MSIIWWFLLGSNGPVTLSKEHLGPDIYSFGVCCVEVTQQNVSCTDVASRRDLREDVCAIVYTYG